MKKGDTVYFVAIGRTGEPIMYSGPAARDNPFWQAPTALAAAQRYLNECADELTAARQKHTAAIAFVAEVAKGTK